MIPLYISGCFGVLHPGRGNRGALICGPLSDEALNVYRPLVFLAEQLAAAEIPALRLAYYGTGDSAGEDDEPGRFDRWLHGIAAGVAWLRDHGGIDHVTLVGYRVGASLAARAACDIDAVDSLVLLNPISGRQLTHELTLAARISQRVWQTTHKADDGTWFESHGLRIDHPTRDALNALDLRRLPACPAAQALVLDTEARPAVSAGADALRQSGTATTLEIHADLACLQRDSHTAEVPNAAFERVLVWMQSLPAAATAPRSADLAGDATAPRSADLGGDATAPRRADLPADKTAPHGADLVAAATLPRSADLASDATVPHGAADLAGEASITIGQSRETPIRFGSGASLFGILTEPLWASRDAPAVLIVNTSANPRWGNARIAVDLARSLAADGVIALRMDAPGMGDSAPDTGQVGRPYAEATTAGTLHAVAELARRTQRQVVVLGICSGAYHALQAAQRDERVAGLVLVNLQRFVWHEGDAPDIIRRTDLRPTSFYVRNILSTQAWLRLLRADFDVANLLRVVAVRLVRRTLAAMDPIVNLVPGGITRVGAVRRGMRALAQRGVPILYVLGRNDPGVEELAEYFGRDGRRLRRLPNVTLDTLTGADHTLGTHALRATLIDLVCQWCRNGWPIRGSVPQRGAADPAPSQRASTQVLPAE